MNDDYEYFTLYHGTSSNHIKSIETYGLDPQKGKKRDDHWLGFGVYYFNNIELATWWAENAVKLNQPKVCKNIYKVIYRSTIKVNKIEILNFDNWNDNIKFKNYIRPILKDAKIAIRSKGKDVKFSEEKLNCLLCNYYKKKNNISLMIRSFPKQTARYAPRIKSYAEFKQDCEGLNIPFYETQFCVSNKECIKDTFQIEN